MGEMEKKSPDGVGGSSPHSSGETKWIRAFLETFSGRDFYHFVKTSCDQRCLYSVTIETRTECFHPRRRLKRNTGDSGPNTSAEIFKLFYNCSFKNNFLIYTHTDIHIGKYIYRQRNNKLFFLLISKKNIE